MTTGRPIATTLIALCLAALALTGCLVDNPFERQSAKERWTRAVGNEQYAGAASVLRGPAVPDWEAETTRLRQQHGKVRAIQSGDLVGWQNEALFTSVRVTWADGHERCLRLRSTADDRLQLLDNGWQDCANVPFNPTPPPGP
ncbi:MAG TPA: hypothetical protein VIL85_13020 [Thermomicrobiales bacterium]|jgi:hypothetical protein